MGQDEIVIHLEQHQLIPQACFALAEGVHPAPDRRHPLTDVEVEALDKRRVDGPATGRQDLLDGQFGTEHHTVFDPDDAPTPVGLDDLRVEQLGSGIHRGLGMGPLAWRRWDCIQEPKWVSNAVA